MISLRSKILIIEDDPGISGFLKTVLYAAGYDIIVTASGKDTLRLISSHCLDCILLDLGLPEPDGCEIMRNVRSWSKIPIIVISARSMENDKAAALDDGTDDYVTKPFGTVELPGKTPGRVRCSQILMSRGAKGSEQ